MEFAIESGWLAPVRRLPSCNDDERPAGADIDLLVIHAISLPPGEFGGPWIDAFFTNQLDPAAHAYFQDIYTLRVSAHLLIRRDGEVVQYVPFHRRAWHAGVSCFDGRERCNDFSIGAELEGCDDEAFSDMQYATLAVITRCLMRHYSGITLDRIVGHSDIAPGRKTDPGPCFDWSRYRSSLDVCS